MNERNEFRRFIVTDTTKETDDMIEKIADFPLQQKLWRWMQKHCQAWNSVLGLQTQIAKDIGSSRANVCNAIKELEKKGFIEKDGKAGTTNKYFLNPHFVWRGEAKDHRLALAKWDKIQQCKAEMNKENDPTNF